MRHQLLDLKKLVVIRDDREKNPFPSDYFAAQATMKVRHLKTADYTFEGAEHLVCIERKESWQEIALNIGKAENRKRFEDMLERMRQFPIRMLIITEDITSLHNFEAYRSMTTRETLLRWYIRVTMEHGVPMHVIGSRKRAKFFMQTLTQKLVEYANAYNQRQSRSVVTFDGLMQQHKDSK